MTKFFGMLEDVDKEDTSFEAVNSLSDQDYRRVALADYLDIDVNDIEVYGDSSFITSRHPGIIYAVLTEDEISEEVKSQVERMLDNNPCDNRFFSPEDFVDLLPEDTFAEKQRDGYTRVLKEKNIVELRAMAEDRFGKEYISSNPSGDTIREDLLNNVFLGGNTVIGFLNHDRDAFGEFIDDNGRNFFTVDDFCYHAVNNLGGGNLDSGVGYYLGRDILGRDLWVYEC